MNNNSKIVIDIQNITVRFNMATEKIYTLKEYAIKLLKRELMFQEFFALKNITFRVKAGESWGLIGTNGAGKSTLYAVFSSRIKGLFTRTAVSLHL